MTTRNGFANDIHKVLEGLTRIMDRMKEEPKPKYDSRTEGALRSLVSAQGQLLKAYSWFDPSNRVPPDAVESWEHFIAKNKIVDELKPQSILVEQGYGEMRFDVIAKINEEYVIIEAETAPPKCIEKMERIKKTIDYLLSGEMEILEEDGIAVFSEIKKQLQESKPLRIIFVVVTKRGVKSTLENIMKTGNSWVHPEVYLFNPKPQEGFPTFKITRYVGK